MASPDPKPARRIRDPETMRELHRRRLPCRICGCLGESLHHLVPRSQGGDDVVENLVMLDGSGTTGCHGKIEAHDKETRQRLRANLRQTELDYIIGKRGRAWLDRFYPEASGTL